MDAQALLVRPYLDSDEPAVIALWDRCNLIVPANDPRQDIRLKLQVQPDLLLVGALAGAVVATVMVGYDGHRGWINYLAVAPEVQRCGLGRRMMQDAEALLRQRGCPKVNLQVRGSNAGVVDFYRRLGFAVEDRISLGKRLR